MTVIPRGSVLHSIEFVRELLPWSNGALSDCIYSIHLYVVQLSNAMPVDCGSIETKMIANRDLQLVTPTGLDWI